MAIIHDVMPVFELFQPITVDDTSRSARVNVVVVNRPPLLPLGVALLAVLGSAAFFAIYHSPLSWLPVGLLGAANALLFKKTGRLAPAVLLHMVYNAVVLS